MASNFLKAASGPLLIGIAAFLWATDALVRYPTSGKLDPVRIVFIEHILGVLVLLPWLLSKYRNSFYRLNLKEWLSALFCGVGGSALAMVFFTASFQFLNPSVAVLLQKLQPVLVVLIAFIVLGERPARKFYIWGLVALLAGIFLSFPDLDFKFITKGVDLHSRGVVYSLAAAFLWAASTVAGKILLKRTPASVATFWRFFFGLVALIVVMLLSGHTHSWDPYFHRSVFYSLLYISLVPGLFAIVIYYSGLARTSASVTTFIELLYPIGAVILNTVFLHTPLDWVQAIAGAILLVAVAFLSF